MLYKECNQLTTSSNNGITFARQITGFLTKIETCSAIAKAPFNKGISTHFLQS